MVSTLYTVVALSKMLTVSEYIIHSVVHLCTTCVYVCRLQYSSASTETDKREGDKPSSS